MYVSFTLKIMHSSGTGVDAQRIIDGIFKLLHIISLLNRYYIQLLAQFDDNVIIGNSIAGVTVQGSKVIDIANQDRGNGIQTGSLDSFQICFEYQLALLDLLAILHMNFEALAAQANSFQTHMDQNLSAVFSYQAACMAGFKHSIYGSIAGSILS